VDALPFLAGRDGNDDSHASNLLCLSGHCRPLHVAAFSTLHIVRLSSKADFASTEVSIQWNCVSKALTKLLLVGLATPPPLRRIARRRGHEHANCSTPWVSEEVGPLISDYICPFTDK
jgi:hypothetical protein